jgi:hypothetical protein
LDEYALKILIPLSKTVSNYHRTTYGNTIQEI